MYSDTNMGIHASFIYNIAFVIPFQVKITFCILYEEPQKQTYSRSSHTDNIVCLYKVTERLVLNVAHVSEGGLSTFLTFRRLMSTTDDVLHR
jgi:hypothetical protein